MKTDMGMLTLGKRSFGAVSSISNSDIAEIVNASTGLVKTLGSGALTLGKGALKVGAVGSAIALILAILQEDAKVKEEAKLALRLPVALSSTLCWVELIGISFWGVLLNETFEFSRESIDGPRNQVDLSVVSGFKVEGRTSWYFGDSARSLTFYTIDGSKYERVYPVDPVSLRFLTTIGVQEIEFASRPQKRKVATRHTEGLFFKRTVEGVRVVDGVFVAPPAYVRPGIIKDVEYLRGRLTQALTCNLDAIINAIGREAFERYFKLEQFKSR